MSYPGLVGHADHPQATSEKLFNQIILFVVERGATEVSNSGCMIDCGSVDVPNESALARFPNALRNHVHRAVERNFRRFLRAWRAVLHFRSTPRMREHLIGYAALR